MRVLFILLMSLFITSCGTYQATTQKDEGCYLQLVGEPKGELVYLNDSDKAISLGEDTDSFYLNGKTATKFKIPKGTHRIKIVRDGKTVMHRKIYVSSGNTYELELP